MADRHVDLVHVLPLVGLLELAAALVDALRDPVLLEFRRTARATGASWLGTRSMVMPWT